MAKQVTDPRVKRANATRQRRKKLYEHLTGVFYAGRLHGFSIIDDETWAIRETPVSQALVCSTEQLQNHPVMTMTPAPGGFVKLPGSKRASWVAA